MGKAGAYHTRRIVWSTKNGRPVVSYKGGTATMIEAYDGWRVWIDGLSTQWENTGHNNEAYARDAVAKRLKDHVNGVDRAALHQKHLERERAKNARARHARRLSPLARCADCKHLESSHVEGKGCAASSPLWKRCQCGMFKKVQECPSCGMVEYAIELEAP